jgi:hypothetical protein
MDKTRLHTELVMMAINSLTQGNVSNSSHEDIMYGLLVAMLTFRYCLFVTFFSSSVASEHMMLLRYKNITS